MCTEEQNGVIDKMSICRKCIGATERTAYAVFNTKKLEIINPCIHSSGEYETFYGTGSFIQFENYMGKEQMPSCR